MPAKRSRPPASVLQWLVERGEEALGQALQDVFKSPGAAASAARTGRGSPRGQRPRNLDALLHLLNLPTRADLQALEAKIEHLHGTVVNLSMKVDRLLAVQDRERPPGKLEPQN